MTTGHDEALLDLGRYIRAQRELHQLSLRHLARTIQVSDSYLSQIERGLYQPSGDILKAIAEGLGLAPNELFERVGWLADTSSDDSAAVSVASAITLDDRLTPAQKTALLHVYRTMAEQSDQTEQDADTGRLA